MRWTLLRKVWHRFPLELRFQYAAPVDSVSRKYAKPRKIRPKWPKKVEGQTMAELTTLSAAARNGDGAAVQQFFGMLCDVL